MSSAYDRAHTLSAEKRRPNADECHLLDKRLEQPTQQVTKQHHAVHPPLSDSSTNILSLIHI
eukprot:8561390-Karenia_brevis.AAC.1